MPAFTIATDFFLACRVVLNKGWGYPGRKIKGGGKVEEDISTRKMSLSEIAEAFNLSERQIQRLAALGIIPKPAKRGQYDFGSCAQAYIRHLELKKILGPQYEYFNIS